MPTPKFLSERNLPVVVVAAVVVLVGLPAALAAGVRWVEWADTKGSTEQAAPNWVAAEPVRVSTSSGEVIKARVALDAPEPETRSLIQSQPQQLALLLQISVAEHDPGDAEGSERMQQLAAHIETRLNAYLVSHKVPPVREVVIQDFVISKI